MLTEIYIFKLKKNNTNNLLNIKNIQLRIIHPPIKEKSNFDQNKILLKFIHQNNAL